MVMRIRSYLSDDRLRYLKSETRIIIHKYFNDAPYQKHGLTRPLSAYWHLLLILGDIR